MITVQETYDKSWMPLNKQVKDLHKELETISNKPDLKTLLVRMGLYFHTQNKKQTFCFVFVFVFVF